MTSSHGEERDIFSGPLVQGSYRLALRIPWDSVICTYYTKQVNVHYVFLFLFHNTSRSSSIDTLSVAKTGKKQKESVNVHRSRSVILGHRPLDDFYLGPLSYRGEKKKPNFPAWRPLLPVLPGIL